jgi:hypothetical protein
LISENIVQKRWKVLREKFSVAYRKFHLDDVQSSWELYNECKFLIPYVNMKPEVKKEDSVQSSSLVEKRLSKSPFDEATLTMMVRERPVLYDKTHEEFRGGSMRKKAWSEIADITGWDEETLQKRWRVMRDRFVRELRRTKNNDMEQQVSCSTFFRDMLFLAKHVKSKKYEAEATDLSDVSQDWDATLANDGKQDVETCIVPETSDSQQIIEETTDCSGNVVTYSIEDGSQPQYLECFESREEADQSELYDDNSNEAPADDYYEEEDEQALESEEQHLMSQTEEVVAVQEIPQNHWYEDLASTIKTEKPKKRRISCVIREDPPSKMRSESPSTSMTEHRNRTSDASESATDEDLAFGQTIGLMLKKIPAHLKTSAKLKIFESLAKFEAEHKYIS